VNGWHTWVCNAVYVVKNLLEEGSGNQGSERPCGSAAQKVQVADFLHDNVQLLAGAESLYLSVEDLT
jgi:hypothetical protein